MKTKYFFVSVFLSLCFVSSACTSTTNNTPKEEIVVDITTIENRQNDYRGGVIRTYSLKDNIINIVSNMRRNNELIRGDNPNTFWNTQGYQDFVATFLTQPIINDTKWFNEEETDFYTVKSTLLSSNNTFTKSNGEGSYTSKYSGIEIIYNEKDDYSITGVTGRIENNDLYKGSLKYRILYDCDKDWCKAYSTLTINGYEFPITAEMFEYARLNKDTFLIQTSKERLLLELTPVEGDIDIREREISAFYYSRLSGGQRTTFTPYQQLPEEDEEGRKLSDNISINKSYNKYPLLNDKGDIATQYGISDSVYLRDDILNTDYKWVFEDCALQQAIIYKNNTLVVTTYNKLSEKYERFIYSVDDIDQKLISEIENMVKIEGLVGVVEVKSTKIIKPQEEELLKGASEAVINDDENENITSSYEVTTENNISAEITDTEPIETDITSIILTELAEIVNESENTSEPSSNEAEEISEAETSITNVTSIDTIAEETGGH